MFADSGEIRVPGWILDKAVAPDAHLRQGDLVHFAEAKDPLRKTGIVVTADCDLEQRKHARLITLVPLIPPSVVLEYYLIPEDCDKKRASIETFLSKTFNLDSEIDRDTRLAALRSITSAEDIEDFVWEALNFLLQRSDSMSVSSYKTLIKEIGSSPKKATAFRDQIRAKGDLLLLPDTGPLGVEGGVVWVRHIWQVPMSDVALRTSELSQRTGERIARLASPFRYRLTQLMAQVFSDIGLPNVPDELDTLMEAVYGSV